MSKNVPSDPSAGVLGQLTEARKRAAESGQGTVLDELARSGTRDWQHDLAAFAGVECVLDGEDVVEHQRVAGMEAVAVVLRDGRERLLLRDPWDDAAVAAAQQRLGRGVEPAATTGALLARICREPGEQRRTSKPDASATGKDEPGGVVAFVDAAIERAFGEGASDVHFECDREGVTVKFRLDGVMAPAARLEGSRRAEEVISRIKVLAQLDITERRLPQDGRFRHRVGDGGLDMRVSIMPSVFGEDAVLRLLDKSHLRATNRDVTLDSLGFDVPNASAIRRLAGLPNGMMLVTGPTGSGKTTTVYAALSEINTGLEKIITIEDPVEYELPGVLQIPVNEKKGLTFAKGLRSILRHDPDRILVGEIRDAETAEIAVQSSLTGHLVFTTVHANSVFDVIGRFRHFGIDMFGFVSSLNGVVVQRLMRRLCPHCAAARAASRDEAAWLQSHGAVDVAEALPSPVGCDRCHRSGYHGRFVIAEVHCIDDAMRDLVLRQADVSELKRATFTGDMKPLLDRAIDSLRRGETSIEEIFRVVGQV